MHLASPRPIDPSEFTAFMRAYQDMVFSTAVRLTANAAQAEDISQEVFLRAYERFDQLRLSPKAGGWLKTVCTNLTLNHLTRHRRRWRLFSEMSSEDAGEEEIEAAVGVFDRIDHVTQELEAEEQARLIERALARLPDHQRLPLALFHFEEMPYQTIADRLGISLAKVKTDILRGRVAMATLLAQSGLDVPEETNTLTPPQAMTGGDTP